MIASYRLISNPSQDRPEVDITVEGETRDGGSIATKIDGVMPALLSLTIPQPTDSETQEISLVARLSPGVSKLFQDAEAGRVIREVDIGLDGNGSGSTDTISLTDVFISAIQFVNAAKNPEVEITLAAAHVGTSTNS